MNARRDEIATPNTRAIPPSAVKDVEESRQQRLQRMEARFRDRGGIFIPTNRNTLADILLGRKEVSPKKSRRSKSRSCSPQKPHASPTSGKEKRVSLTSSAAIISGKISVAKPAPRRSPRKKVPSKSSATAATVNKHARDTKKRKASRLAEVTSTLEHASVPSVKPRKGKATASVEEDKDEYPEAVPAKRNIKKSKLEDAPSRTQGTTTEKASRKAGKAKGTPSEPSTSRLPSQGVTNGVDEPPLPPPKSQRKATASKSKKAPPSFKEKQYEAEDPPPPAPKARSKSTKRRLSIVQEEDEEERDAENPQFGKRKQRTKRAATPPAPAEPSRKKRKPTPDVPTASTETEACEPDTKAPSVAKSKQKIPARVKAPEETIVPDIAPTKSLQKRPAAPLSTESEPSRKRTKTLPLQDLGAREAKSKKPTSVDQRGSQKMVRQQKENTPVSDCSEAKPAKVVKLARSKSRTKPPPAIRGPRKSVLVRMREPLPPIEDNDPDPIDFLS